MLKLTKDGDAADDSVKDCARELNSRLGTSPRLCVNVIAVVTPVGEHIVVAPAGYRFTFTDGIFECDCSTTRHGHGMRSSPTTRTAMAVAKRR
jgi:hypothetical protein